MADPLTVACEDCLAPIDTPCTSPLLAEGEPHPTRQHLANLRAVTHGTCNLCGQWIVKGLDPVDAWHPDPLHASACPPMPDPITDWNNYAVAINAGTRAGYPGIEHFTPDLREPDPWGADHDAAWDAQIDADLTEQGRALASQRDDLIAAGVDPAELLIPTFPIICPECAAGKCPNCTTQTLHPATDELTPCTCIHGATGD